MIASNNYTYKNREKAAILLANFLSRYAGLNGVVLSIPRGGVAIGYIIAKALNFKLDLALSKKIGHPIHREYAIGAVSLYDSFVKDLKLVSQEYVEKQIQAIRRRLNEIYKLYMGSGHSPEILSGKIVILTDDGLATGNTMLSSLHTVRKQHPRKVIVAAPVSSQAAINLIAEEADEVVCPLIPYPFNSVGQFYEDFRQLSDKDVIEYIERHNNLNI